MDKETRFLLASTISEKREVEDARNAFQKAKNVAKSKPLTVTTDGLQSYQDAFKRNFSPLEILELSIFVLPEFRASRRNNNVVERLNGTVRERNKVMRGLKNENTPISKGFQIYYNFVKPHQSLNGQTPAQKAGIGFGSEENKWLQLIKESLHNSN
jgi:transposase-like protein